MKIKYLNVSAFRCFEYPGFSVDFCHAQRQTPANLVAIYAPNGFGKTSLLDALEFTFTDHVQRVELGNGRENISVDGHLSSNELSFLHNKYSVDYPISLEVGLEGQPALCKQVGLNEEKNLTKAKLQREYFRDVLLSQDWFDEFLSTTDSTERYRIFVKYFHEGPDLQVHRDKLTQADKLLQGKDKSIRLKIKEIQEQIGNQEGVSIQKILPVISQFLEDLSQMDVQLSGTIDELNGESLVALLDEVNGWSAQKKQELSDCEDQMRDIKSHLEDSYWLTWDSKKQELLSKQEQLESSCQSIIAHQQLLSEITKCEQERQEVMKAHAKVFFMINHQSEFVVKKEILDAALKKLEMIDSRIQELFLLVSAHRTMEQFLFNQKESLRKEISHSELLNEECRKKKDRLEQIEKQRLEGRGELDGLTQRYESLVNKTFQLSADYAAYQQVLSSVCSKELPDMKVGMDYGINFAQLQELIQQKKIMQDQLDQFRARLQNRKEFVSSVRHLVDESLSLLEEMQMDACPLCGTRFVDYADLVHSIKNHMDAEGSMADDNEEILRGMNRIVDLDCHIADFFSQLECFVREKITLINSDILKTQRNLDELKAEQQRKEGYVSILERESNELKAWLSEHNENNTIEVLQEQLSSIEQDWGNESLLLRQFLQEIDELKEKRKDLDKTISSVKYDQMFHEYEEYAGGSMVNSDDIPVWQIKEAFLQERLIQLNTQKAQLEIDRIIGSQLGVDRLSKEDIDRNMAEQRVVLNEMDNRFKDWVWKAHKKYQFPFQECITVEELLLHYNTLYQTLEKKYEHLQSLIHRLADFSDKLVLAKASLCLLDLRNQLEELKLKQNEYKEMRKEIKLEIKRVDEHIQSYVDRFFCLDLINRLYNSIDPHLEYKRIIFELQMNLVKPKLHVMLETVKADDTIVPNLYLSTAQKNIISFCIFLAKAMSAKDDKGKDVDCIFIDDPVQAMDEINVLSVIDLIRNVAFSYNKQVVITTHDKNFFKLLQKKCPDRLFNSRFIEFETKGKVGVTWCQNRGD